MVAVLRAYEDKTPGFIADGRYPLELFVRSVTDGTYQGGRGPTILGYRYDAYFRRRSCSALGPMSLVDVAGAVRRAVNGSGEITGLVLHTDNLDERARRDLVTRLGVRSVAFVSGCKTRFVY